MRFLFTYAFFLWKLPALALGFSTLDMGAGRLVKVCRSEWANSAARNLPSSCSRIVSNNHRLFLTEDDSSSSSNNNNEKNDDAVGYTPMLIILRHNPSGQIPMGWRLADPEEARARQNELVESFGRWDICELSDCWKVDGPGYGGKILKQVDGETMVCQVITPRGELARNAPMNTGIVQESPVLDGPWQ